MVEVVVSTDNVVVLGGPEAVEVETGVGAEGKRGSVWLSGDGNPNLKNIAIDFTVIPQTLDRYIDIDPNSDTYLNVFRYLSVDGQNTWEKDFSLNNTPYSINEVVQFTNGQAVFNVDITELGIDSSFVDGFDNSFAYFNVQATASNVDAELAPAGTNNPIAFSITVDDAYYDSAGITDSQEVPFKLPLIINAVEFNGTAWVPVNNSIIMYFTVSYADPNTIISNLAGGVS